MINDDDDDDDDVLWTSTACSRHQKQEEKMPTTLSETRIFAEAFDQDNVKMNTKSTCLTPECNVITPECKEMDLYIEYIYIYTVYNHINYWRQMKDICLSWDTGL